MIITSLCLPGLSIKGLKVIAHQIDNQPRLIAIDWLSDSVGESDLSAVKGQDNNGLDKNLDKWSKTIVGQAPSGLSKLMRHYQIKDDEAYYIDENSLSKDDSLQALLLSTIKQLQQYANGERQAFDLPLDLSQGSPFQQRVWQALQDISYGETISYAQLAQNIGQPTAYRAVANANGKNPFSIVIPCHRVIASDGSLGGYTGGLDKKRLLLAIESQHD